jgi:regulator of protease activity HflC (stomatin/prohibitin superfamily)
VNDETVTDGAGDGSAVEFPGARVLRAVVSSVAQSVLTHYAMHHLFEVKRDITEQVRIAVAAAASPYGIVVESAQLVRVEVPPLVEAALEASAISKLEIKRGETHKEMMRSAFAIQVGAPA